MKRIQGKPGIPFWFLLILFFLSMILFTIFTSNGYLDLSELKKEHSKILLQVDTLEAANTDLHYQIYLLKNDLDYIEQVAREELNMVKPDEMVFKFAP